MEPTCTSSWRFLEVPYRNATSGIDELIKNWTWFLNNNRISYIKARWRNSHQNIRNIARFDWTFVELSPRMLNLQHQWSHHLLLKATQQPPRNDFRKSKRSHQPSSWNSRSWLPPSTLHWYIGWDGLRCFRNQNKDKCSGSAKCANQREWIAW